MVEAEKSMFTINATNRNILLIKNKIVKFCHDYHISTIVIHHPVTVLLILLPFIKKLLPHVKFVMYAHSNAKEILRTHEKLGLFLRKCIIHKAFETVDVIIAISNSVRNSIIDDLCIKNKIITLYNGINLDNFRLRPVYNQKNSRFIYVGRLVEMKGLQVIFKCLSEIDLPSNFVFTIIGDGPYRPKLEKLALSLNLSKYIVFKGQTTSVQSYLINHDVFVHYPIIEEGFGLTIVEAMSSGLICLCRRTGGISEIISSGVDGYLVNSEKELKQKISYLLNKISFDEDNAISKKAVERAQYFSIHSYAKQLDSLLRSI